MARKNTDINEIARSLKAPAFGNSHSVSGLEILDPVSPTTLVLKVSEIQAYKHNPRLAENREYPRLKDSIRTRRGLTTPLTVTKRPGDALYTIAAGGNSRLKALNELVKETGDDAFALVTCQFEPWESEYQVFANHLIENDIRGTMTFGDKARAIVEWQRLYQESHPDQRALTQRELAARLSESGFRVHQTMITPLMNTALLLLPHLPTLFGSGLGRPGAEALLRLRGSGERYWTDCLLGQDAVAARSSYSELFAEICAAHDCHCADWEHELFQSAFTTRMAEALNVDRKLVALDIDSLYHGYSIETPPRPDSKPGTPGEPDEAQAKALQDPSAPWVFERSREIDAIRMARSRARIDAKSSRSAERKVPEDDPHFFNEEASGETNGSADVSPSSERLREANYLAARDVAQGQELDQYVQFVESGLGFFIEAPEPTDVLPEDKERSTGPGEGLVLRGIRSNLWWLLCLTADQLVDAHLAHLAKSFPASWLIELFTEVPIRNPDQDAMTMLQVLVGEPSAQGQIIDILTEPSMGDEVVDALDRLFRGCRALRRMASAGNLDLWEDA